MKTPNPLPRRSFLRHLSATTLGLPFVGALASTGCESAGTGVGSTSAALGDDEPILITMITPDGVGEGWHPTGSGTDFTLSPAFAALESRRADLSLFRNLNMPNDGGGAACSHRQALGLWTGSARNGDWSAKGPSFDTVVGQATQDGRPLDVLRLGCQTPGNVGVGSPSYGMDGQAARIHGSPRRTFTMLFGEMPGGEGADPLRASVLDGMTADFDRLKLELSGVDRSRLDQHLTAVRELEMRFAMPVRECEMPGTAADWPNHGGGFDDYSDPDLTLLILEANRELLALALACGQTRVVSMMHLQEGEGGRTSDYTFLDSRLGNLHQISHSRRHDLMPIVDAYDLEYVASIATRLEDFGLMDRTLIVWGSGMSNGAAHDSVNLPALMLGNACGRLRPGQLIDAGGRSYNDLILTVLSAFGLEAETFGEESRCAGAFGELLA